MNSSKEESIGRQIYICGQAMRKYADQKLKKHDLTVEQLHIMKQLNPTDGLTQSQLCGLVVKSPANITRILDRLERKRRISRRTNPDDRRSTLVFLTGEGEKLLDAVEVLLGGLKPEVAAGVTPEEREIAMIVLKKILHSVS